jgi:predicted transcriptional regulator
VSTTPRPKRSGRCLSVELAPELLAQLREVAAARGQTLAELVRRALAELVAAADPQAGPAAGRGLAERVAQLEASTAELLQTVAQLQAQGPAPRSPGRVNTAPRSGDASSPVRVMPAAAIHDSERP